jgi:acetylornithine/N-succinyldiaminopimelate aminotransferase
MRINNDMSNRTKQLFKDYSLNTYTRVGPVFVKGKGSWLWDEAGKRYLDLFPGWGVSILGHSHPVIAAVISRQAKNLLHLPNNLFFPQQAELARVIVDKSFPAKVFFGNSGAEAVEGAVKISRLFGKGSRHEIITMKNSFHGRTFAALSATGQKKYQEPFKPIVSGFKHVVFNDISALTRKITSKTVAVMLELIQGEGGLNISDIRYIKEVAKLCKSRNMLFIVDEIQTGMGRTGALFAYQHYGIKPDLMLLSKGLGAGVPISAMVVAKNISGVIQPGMHASTFGGSPLVTAVSRATFEIIERENLLSNASSQGEFLIAKLRELKEKYSFIGDVRGKGLMVGLELTIPGQAIFSKCLEKGLLINCTHGNVLRIMPALNVSKYEIEYGVSLLDQVLSEEKN